MPICPAVEDTTGIGAERDDVPKDLQLGEGLVDLDVMAMAMAFDSSSETAES